MPQKSKQQQPKAQRAPSVSAEEIAVLLERLPGLNVIRVGPAGERAVVREETGGLMRKIRTFENIRELRAWLLGACEGGAAVNECSGPVEEGAE